MKIPAWIVAASLFPMISLPSVAQTEQAEINAVLREIEYLREHVAMLAEKYGKKSKDAKIRFNYQALIEQLITTENGIRAYLNAEIDVLHLTPPKPVEGNMVRVRRN